jgi:hypothetical protein
MYRIFCSSSSVSLCAHYIDHGARPRIFETRTKIKEEEKKGLTKNMWKLYSWNRMMTIHSQMGRWKRARLLYSAFCFVGYCQGGMALSAAIRERCHQQQQTLSSGHSNAYINLWAITGHNVTWTSFATFFYYYSAYWKSFLKKDNIHTEMNSFSAIF